MRETLHGAPERRGGYAVRPLVLLGVQTGCSTTTAGFDENDMNHMANITA